MARKNMKQEVGTIYQKPNGTYHYRYQINGERKSISLKTKNLEEAKRKVKELLPVLKATNMEVVSAHVAHARNRRNSPMPMRKSFGNANWPLIHTTVRSSGFGKSSLRLPSIVPMAIPLILLYSGVKTAKSRNTIHAVLPLPASRNRHCWTYWPILRTR